MRSSTTTGPRSTTRPPPPPPSAARSPSCTTSWADVAPTATESRPVSPVIERYLELGLRLGRHVDGFVDAYYGPQSFADRVEAEPISPADGLVDDAARLIADLDGGAGDDLGADRRR